MYGHDGSSVDPNLYANPNLTAGDNPVLTSEPASSDSDELVSKGNDEGVIDKVVTPVVNTVKSQKFLKAVNIATEVVGAASLVVGFGLLALGYKVKKS